MYVGTKQGLRVIETGAVQTEGCLGTPFGFIVFGPTGPAYVSGRQQVVNDLVGLDALRSILIALGQDGEVSRCNSVGADDTHAVLLALGAALEFRQVVALGLGENSRVELLGSLGIEGKALRINPLSVDERQRLLLELARLRGEQVIWLGLGELLRGEQSIRLNLGELHGPPSALRLSLGEDGKSTVLGALGSEARQGLLLYLPGEVTGRQGLLLVLSGDYSLGDVQRLLLELSGAAALGRQRVQLELSEESPTVYPQVEWDVLLDGSSIKDKIKSVRLIFSEGDLLSQVEIEVVDPGLYFQADPAINCTGERLEVRLKDEVFRFLLEDREGDEQNFLLWGRPKGALLGEPFSLKESQEFEHKMASEIVSELAAPLTVDWQAEDYFVESFSFEGYPLDGIRRLAEAVGAVVRDLGDGKILVRPKFPVRPVDLADASPQVSFDRWQNILQLDYSEERSLYDRVTVSGTSSPSSHVRVALEVDETCYLLDEEAQIRACPEPYDLQYDLCVTAGEVSFIASQYREETETIEITDGRGAVRYPIWELLDWSWIGQDGGTPSWEKGSREVLLQGMTCGLLEVTYRVRYDLWRVTCAEPKEVLVCALVGEEQIPQVEVVIGDGSREAPEITDELIRTERLAIVRGMAFLDDHHYRKLKRRLRVPYAGVKDGDVVQVSDERLGITGNHLVKAAEVLIERSEAVKVYQELEVHQYASPSA